MIIEQKRRYEISVMLISEKLKRFEKSLKNKEKKLTRELRMKDRVRNSNSKAYYKHECSGRTYLIYFLFKQK